ncbi:translation machinery-associated protein 16-like [Ptychodera flava]|uniref:translation machinery-associated protein 16-like n=1 Tax=Ptychodera flava TaxID=63121 RepID=UPI003969F836
MPKASNLKLGQQRKPVHPSSRKAAQLTRGAQRKEKRSLRESERSIRQNALLEKLYWFHDRLDPDKTVYTKGEVCQLIELYLERFDDELEQIDIVHSIKNRQGRQHASREAAIKTTLEKERNEYETCGLEVPDLMNGKHFRIFRAWNRDVRYLTAIKLTCVKARKISDVTDEAGGANQLGDKDEEIDDSDSDSENT